MSRARRAFPPELLAHLHAMQVTAALDLLGLYWKHDPDFKPINLTGEYILDASQIEPAFIRLDVGNVADPHLVWLGRFEFLVQQVICDW